MAEPRRNIEFKAKDGDPRRSLAVCESLGATDCGLLAQRDTYFNAREGRLKLRQEEGAEPHLIAYERPDLSGERESRYRIIPVTVPEELKAALAITLGVMTVVTKSRHLLLWQGNVRIHLDAVDGLGNFIEFEAVATADSDLSRESDQARRLREAFEIEDVDVIAGSYRDLMTSRASAIEPGGPART